MFGVPEGVHEEKDYKTKKLKVNPPEFQVLDILLSDQGLNASNVDRFWRLFVIIKNLDEQLCCLTIWSLVDLLKKNPKKEDIQLLCCEIFCYILECHGSKDTEKKVCAEARISGIFQFFRQAIEQFPQNLNIQWNAILCLTAMQTNQAKKEDIQVLIRQMMEYPKKYEIQMLGVSTLSRWLTLKSLQHTALDENVIYILLDILKTTLETKEEKGGLESIGLSGLKESRMSVKTQREGWYLACIFQDGSTYTDNTKTERLLSTVCWTLSEFILYSEDPQRKTIVQQIIQQNGIETILQTLNAYPCYNTLLDNGIRILKLLVQNSKDNCIQFQQSLETIPKVKELIYKHTSLGRELLKSVLKQKLGSISY